MAMKTARSMTMFFCLVFMLLLSLIPSASSAVFSVDLGSEWMKVAVVDVKPGQSPISIALNEMSKRKSPALVAFSGGSRMLAEEAVGIAARYPERVYSRLRDMVGKPSDTVKELASASYLPYDIVEESPGAASIRVDDQEIYRTEELLAMVLSYCRDLAEGNVKSAVKDAVITVPPYFGQAERRAILAAAQAAGINVLSLMNEHAAAALQYGIDKDFSNESRYVLFYDMGANSAFAAVVHFSSYTVKEWGKNVSNNYFELKGIRWDAEIGGQAIEMRLVDHFAKEFEKQTGVDVRKFPKAMAKLKKQAKRTKEILSANTEAQFFVDSLYDDRDFKSHITREAFEELCSDIWARAVVPLKKVLEDVGISPDELYAVELLGGGTRVPKLQQVLTKSLGKKGLERHLDADEAIALGAALHAANLSDGIKLNKKFGMVDGASYGIVMKIEEPDSMNEVVVSRLKKLPSKLARAVKKQEDFQVSLFYDPDGELPPGIKSGEISVLRISGVTDAVSKYASFNLSAPIKSLLHFSLSRSGVLSLDRAEAVIEITEWVDVPVKNSSNNSSGVSNTSVIEEDPATKEEAKPQEEKVERKLRKRTIRVPLKIEALRDVGALSDEKLAEFRIRLQKLKLIDDEKRQTEEAKNNLESYIYTTKEMLDSIKAILQVSTEQQREEFIAKLDEAADWLYSDGESAGSVEFKKRLQELKAIGDPIFFRLEQLQARPSAVEAAYTYLAEADAIINGWKSSKPWISDTEVRKEVDAVKSWLDSKVSQQKKIANHEEPAFSSTEVFSKIDKLRALISKTSKTPKPKPNVEKKPPKPNNEAQSPDAEQTEAEPSPASEHKEAEPSPDSEHKEADAPANDADAPANDADAPAKETQEEKEVVEGDPHDEL